MNLFELEFHHIGMAVENPKKTIQFLGLLGYEISRPVYDGEQKANLIMCVSKSPSHAEPTQKYMPNIEIIYPSDTPGPIDNMVKKHGEIIYHTCYTTSNKQENLRKMAEAGHRVICLSPEKPAILFGGRKVSFYRVSGFGIIEFLE